MTDVDGAIALETVRIKSSAWPEALAWADGLSVKMPSDLARLRGVGDAAWAEPRCTAVAARAATLLRDSRAVLSAPPRSTTLPINYRMVPGPLRRGLARFWGRAQRARVDRWATFPAWPLDLSADVAADLAGGGPPGFVRTPVLLTHDLDSSEGLSNLVASFLPVEEAVGARSASFVVPFAWPLDHALLAEAVARGHEIGVHGYDHSNRTPFSAPAERARRLTAGAELGRRYGATGYRAPSLVRSRELLADLAQHYAYDSSIPTSGGLFPVPNNGCATARPWRIGSLWELPLSLPRDGSLRFLGYGAAEILELWLSAAQTIHRSGGIVTLLTHCERGFSGNPPMLSAYRDFLAAIAADPAFEIMLPGALVRRLIADDAS